ncbi:MAG TPA: hypothetical protein VN418_06335 [Gammaproteobacteria bacterium]|nr:hypothetical protein [Gammaproteobacteria bacterium]
MNPLPIVLFLAGFVFIAASYPNLLASETDNSRICKGNPEVVGSCYLFHGKLFVANGTPGIRILKLGTRRIVGVIPSENEIAPPALIKNVTFGRYLYGDFEVCPFTIEKKGYMQSVCIEKASNMVMEEFFDGKLKQKVYKVYKLDNNGNPLQQP